MTDEDEDGDTPEELLSRYMSSTVTALKLLRSKSIRKKFPRMCKMFEADLEDVMSGNPYKPSRDGGNDYRKPGEDEAEFTGMTGEERSKVQEARRIIAEDAAKRQPDADGVRRLVTADSVLPLMNAMRIKRGLPALELRKKTK